jgi:CRP-like cAMP-binding protein
LKEEFDRNTEMRDVLLRYTQAFIAQISQNVACNRLHNIDQRIARWLLEVCDRVRHKDFSLTHEFIAEMLGVRRAGVSTAAAKLARLGIIQQGRMSVKIKNVAGLERASCECYAALKNEYARLLE